MQISRNRFLQSLRWLALLLLAVVVASCNGSGNCVPSNGTVVGLHTFPNGSQLFGTTSLNVTSGESTTATYVLKGGSGLTIVNLSTQESGLNTTPLSHGLTSTCALCGSFNPESLVVTGTSAESSSQLNVTVRSGLTAGTYKLNLYATYTNGGVTQPKEQIGVITVVVTSGSSPQIGTLVIHTVAESNIAAGGTTTALVSIENSSGITVPVNVAVASNDTAVMTVSPASCALTTASNSCTVTLTGVAAGTTTFSATATGYTIATSQAISVTVTTGWTRQSGVTNKSVTGYGISLDAAGNSYVTGASPGDGGSSARNYFILKFDNAGTVVWSRVGGVYGGQTYGRSITTDSLGNSYVVGDTNHAITGAQTGRIDFFIAKYDSSGTLAWVKQAGVSGGDSVALGVSMDSSSNAYITGYTTKAFSGQTQHGAEDYFIAKYDSSGNQVWIKQVGGSDINNDVTEGKGISVDANGNSYITGITNVGISGQVEMGFGDYFIAKYDTNGNLQWTKQVGGSSSTQTNGYGISSDSSGNSYITGSTTGSISGQTQIGSTDYFVAKYDSDGNLKWAKQTAGSAALSSAYGFGINVDSNNNSYITGMTTSSLAVGLTQSGMTDYFIAKYDASGTLVWTTQVGAAGGYTAGAGIGVDSYGTSYITGSTTVGIAGNTETGISDMFVNKTPNLSH
ncbi:MAG: hypothetical protein E6Q32_05410 [Neisseriales bacterium]|nr:MAG: hypothetical protein E6Q32_05410 [Neisseriales bacterium]